MSSYNKVMLVGNLTRDPELKTVPSGSKLVELGLAINRTMKGENGESKTETTFVDVTVWGRSAENAAKFLSKGRSVLVEGRLQMDSWEDRKTGQMRTKLKVVADQVQFLDSQKASASEGQHRQENYVRDAA